MAVTTLTLTALATSLFKDTGSSNAAIVVKATAGTLYIIHVDNSGNAAAASYVKLYDSAGAVTIGTTAPDWIFKVAGAYHGEVLVIPGGVVFASGLQVATVTTGGTAGTTGPTSGVTVEVAFT